MTSSWRVRRGASLLAVLAGVVTLATFAWQPAAATRSTARTHRQWHNKPGWAPPLFREPVQGVKVAGQCTFPTYDEVARKHPELAATIGEDDTETCAGVMYFGDWAGELERLERSAIENGARTDTVRAARLDR
jgi:hypothetical protein